MEINVCASCGGHVEFSPKDRALRCVNCGNVYPIECRQTVVKQPVHANASAYDMTGWAQNNRSFVCSNCGASVILNRMDVATKCQYCNTTSLVPLESLPGLKPEIVLPFKISKEDAKTEFYARVKKRHFLPIDFRKNLPKADLGATYISSFTFAMQVDATYSGRQRITKSVRDSNGRTRTITKYKTFSGRLSKLFDNLVVEASDKLNQDEILKVFPYDFNESYDYDDDFIKGYNVGYYNQTVEDAEGVARRDALRNIESVIRGKYSSIESLTVNPTYSNIKYNYALLPVYFVTFNYKDKPYINVMNGQTGRVGGAVPRSKLQITLFTIFMILIIGLPIIAIALSN